MRFEITDRVSPAGFARITGGFYVAFIATSVLADALGHIGLGDTVQVHDAITTRPQTFRAALAVAFVSAFLFLMAAWGLYVVLRGVDHDLALLFLLLNAVGVAVQCASMLGLVWAFRLGDPGLGPTALGESQTDALVRAGIDTYRTGFVIAQLFFGTWLFPLGLLVYRSGLLPRILGVLLLLDGVAELVWFTQALLLPTHPGIRTPGTAVSFLAEVGLALWLVVRGVKDVGRADASPLADASSDGGSVAARASRD